MKKLCAHIFVCTNERPPGHPKGCCATKGSAQLVAALKEELANRRLLATVRAQKAGCLDACEQGPSIVVYPEGVWYAKVTPADVPEIVESHIVGGRPVERLKRPGK